MKLYEKKTLGGKKMNINLIDAIALISMAILVTLFCTAGKKPQYRKFKNKEGKLIKVNMTLINLIIPVIIWLVLFLPYLYWRAGM